MTLLKDQPVWKGLRKHSERMIIKFIEISFSFIKWIFRYSGLEFIYRKFNPSKNPQPLPTGFIWLIGIYVAFFGVASQKYENRVDIIENRANSIFTQLATDVYKKALGRISTVQNMWCPEKPEILNPPSVFRSLFKETKHQEIVELLKEMVEDWKDKLNHVKLLYANLRDADLERANLERANLLGANLKYANLRDADLERANLLGANLEGANLLGANLLGANLERANLLGANLKYANLKDADLERANLLGAKLEGANLLGANLLGADLERANLKYTDLRDADLEGANLSEASLRNAKGLAVEQLCKALVLYRVKLNQELEAQINQECPNLLKKP